MIEKRPMTESEYLNAVQSLTPEEKRFRHDYSIVFPQVSKLVQDLDSWAAGGVIRQALLTLLEMDKKSALDAGISIEEINQFDANVKEIIKVEGLPETKELKK